MKHKITTEWWRSYYGTTQSLFPQAWCAWNSNTFQEPTTHKMILMDGISAREENWMLGSLQQSCTLVSYSTRSSFSRTGCSHPKSRQISSSCSKCLIWCHLPALDVDTSEDKDVWSVISSICLQSPSSFWLFNISASSGPGTPSLVPSLMTSLSLSVSSADFLSTTPSKDLVRSQLGFFTKQAHRQLSTFAHGWSAMICDVRLYFQPAGALLQYFTVPHLFLQESGHSSGILVESTGILVESCRNPVIPVEFHWNQAD